MLAVDPRLCSHPESGDYARWPVAIFESLADVVR
jgi:hypothetical protein